MYVCMYFFLTALLPSWNVQITFKDYWVWNTSLSVKPICCYSWVCLRSGSSLTEPGTRQTWFWLTVGWMLIKQSNLFSLHWCHSWNQHADVSAFSNWVSWQFSISWWWNQINQQVFTNRTVYTVLIITVCYMTFYQWESHQPDFTKHVQVCEVKECRGLVPELYSE